MKALLDTRTFLWAISGDPKLSPKAQQIFTGPSDLWLSVASLWEILIKVQGGKLPIPSPAGPYIVKEMAKNNIEVLPINLDHVLRLETLPVYHRDPFDRLLIAQSIEEEWPIVTADPHFARYPVQVIW
jgi:PIN domain nuclease of toxin-antitoxin system